MNDMNMYEKLKDTDYNMKIEFTDMKTGKMISKNIFYNKGKEEFTVIGDENNIVYLTDQDFYKTIENFKNGKEMY